MCVTGVAKCDMYSSDSYDVLVKGGHEKDVDMIWYSAKHVLRILSGAECGFCFFF